MEIRDNKKLHRIKQFIQTVLPIAKPGYPIISIFILATSVLILLNFSFPSVLCLIVTIFICWFFRDPGRVIPSEKGMIVSPADGRVISSDYINESQYYEGQCKKISIFMNVFNVHVNRIPYEGTVTKVSYSPGKFFAANLDKASKDNEQNAVFLRIEENRKICVVQIAGLIARRIVCGVKKGDKMERGQRYGMICFGSRLDVYLPVDTNIKVSIGDKVKAGTSVLGCLE